MRSILAVSALLISVLPAPAQLTTDQKVFDFEVLASLYAKRYAPYEWKKTFLSYDALDLRPWLDRVRKTDNDLDYFETLVEYVAKLTDTHSNYRLPSSFVADLGFRVDVYYDDNDENPAVRIDLISTNILPPGTYPFRAGDELVSIDGVKALDQAQKFLKYVNSANPRSAIRTAASYLPVRQQTMMPHAIDLPDSALVEIRRQSGQMETYTLPWVKSGEPMMKAGPAPMPTMAALKRRASTADGPPDCMRTLSAFANDRDETPPEILNYGSLSPIWAMPAGYEARLGSSITDDFLSGVMTANGHRIAFLRIPTFGPLSSSAAIRQLETELKYFQDNTEAMVLDEMRNTGGDPCYAEQVFARLTPNSWRALGRQLRIVWSDVAGFRYDLDLARMTGASQSAIDLLQARLNDAMAAYYNNRGMTAPLSVCSGGLDRDPAAVNYSKPIMLLTDEFSTSAADGFAALFQDNNRGKIFGWRTNGAGGGVYTYNAGAFSEFGTARVTGSMHYRANPVIVSGYPEAHVVENIGVQPDIPYNYMKTSNLLQRGKPFVDAFLAAVVRIVEGQ